ncbi:molybdenum cofactor guanylyltransferase MobA [Nitratireductor kimnyeongensis]|uniref:Molybdenum cofactor guanylyltransferase n=1 Tax=Nitratireductor kimnyeongensis TaxID=430679 RepID=A0ABW0T9G4_9HYPH|nr:molybdenum cofactor guanylyltransferase MobA [Nitratireductor kimnyeongensis]QZZ35711.1 molybdenum cofactor guanylyltransferase MobA [Nitratireductor kimnyeongensis]
MSLGVAGVILAGGTAQRMGGGDKGLLRLNTKTIIETVMERLAPQVDRMVLNANGDPQRFASLGLEVVADPLPEPMGPLGGVLAGLEWAEENAPGLSHIVTAAADTPFLPADLVPRLMDAALVSGGPAMARSNGALHPVFALWPLPLANDLARHLISGGTRRLRAYACERHNTAFVDFPCSPDADPFFNINTPEDLQTARERHQREAM